MFKRFFIDAAAAYGAAVTDGQVEQFCRYHDLLIEWNQHINLTAITEPEQVAVKHMIDSLSCYDQAVFKENSTVIDVGTGAGFPGLPLKIWREDVQLTLLDSLNKRLNFLRAVTESLDLTAVDFVHGRAEDIGKQRQYREKYDVAVSRAVARLNVLCELCLPFVAVGGYFVALKGAQYEDEVREAEPAIRLLGGTISRVVPIILPGIDDVRAVIYIEKVKRTPSEYPRRAGTPEKSPLSS